MAAEPIRIEGPTPAGYAYALVCELEDGSIHITEYDEDGKGRRSTTAFPAGTPTRREPSTRARLA